MSKKEKDQTALIRDVEDKICQLLPDYGDRVFIKEEGNTIVSKVSHSLPGNGKGDFFVCLTPEGEINLKDLKLFALRYLNDKLNCKRYTFSDPPVVINRLRSDITNSEYKQAVIAAKQAYHDRIVSPYAHHFTSEQANALKNLRAMFTADSSTIGIFHDLALEVGKEPDVIRKPEKWRMEAFDELITLGQEIIIDIANNRDYRDYQKNNNFSQAMADAKQAIRERITNSWQRTFSPNQLFDLSYYAGVCSDVIPSELFRHLYEDVIKEPEVARKPEKWKTDTLKELNDLAEGITREESRGLHI